MATSVATPNFSASTSSFRASQATASMSPSYSDNPITQLPRVDFNFEDLRQRMAAFTVKFDAFIERGRKRVLEERNEFRGRLSELSEDQNQTQLSIATLSSTLQSHATLLTRESAEKAEMHAQISSLESHQAAQAATRDRLKSAISHTQRQIDAKLDAQRQYSEKMDKQARMNGPELMFWETYLGLRIEGSGNEDVVKICFVFEPGMGGDVRSAEEREGILELKVPERSGYEVVYTKPRLEEGNIRKVVEKLNESRDVGAFLKGMRGLFAESFK